MLTDAEIDALIAAGKEKARQQELAAYEATKLKARKGGEKLVAAEEKAERTARLTPMSAVRSVRTKWLWEGRIPMGEITLVAGRGGIGKSLFLNTITAWITTGTMRGEYEAEPRNVIYVANEDSYERTVRPRLMAAGANMDRVFRLDMGDARLILPSDCELLAEKVREVDAVAAVFDPLSSNMGDRDRNSPEVRASYERLRQSAEDLGVAYIGNGHTRKGQSQDFMEGLMGSSEIANVARAVIGIIRDPDSEEPQVILSQCKNNYGRSDLKSYTYRIVEEQWWEYDELIAAPKLVWGESTDRHANDVMAEGIKMESASDVVEAVAWLRDYLSITPGCPRAKVVADAMKVGIRDHTLRRASRRLKVVATRHGFPSTTLWSLPATQS